VIEQLVEGVLNGRRRAVARVISLVTMATKRGQPWLPCIPTPDGLTLLA